jgi:hypothetical protein
MGKCKNKINPNERRKASVPRVIPPCTDSLSHRRPLKMARMTMRTTKSKSLRVATSAQGSHASRHHTSFGARAGAGAGGGWVSTLGSIHWRRSSVHKEGRDGRVTTAYTHYDTHAAAVIWQQIRTNPHAAARKVYCKYLLAKNAGGTEARLTAATRAAATRTNCRAAWVKCVTSV